MERPELRERNGGMTLRLAPAEAAARRLEDGQRVVAWNDLGEVVFVLRVDARVPAGIAVAEGVWWIAHAPGGRNVNALTSQRLTDAGVGLDVLRQPDRRPRRLSRGCARLRRRREAASRGAARALAAGTQAEPAGSPESPPVRAPGPFPTSTYGPHPRPEVPMRPHLVPLLAALAFGAPARAEDGVAFQVLAPACPRTRRSGSSLLPSGNFFCPLLADPKSIRSFASFLYGKFPEGTAGRRLGSVGVGDGIALLRLGGPRTGRASSSASRAQSSPSSTSTPRASPS